MSITTFDIMPDLENVQAMARNYDAEFLGIDNIGIAEFGFPNALVALSFQAMRPEAINLLGVISNPNDPVTLRVNVSLYMTAMNAEIDANLAALDEETDYDEDIAHCGDSSCWVCN